MKTRHKVTQYTTFHCIFAVTNEQVNNPNHQKNENNALDDVHPTGSNTCFNSMC